MKNIADLIVDCMSNPELLEPCFSKLIMYCIAQASKGPETISFKGQDVGINAGEFVTNRETLTKDMNFKVSEKSQANVITWWRRLQKLETEKVIFIRSTNKYSIIKIAVDSFSAIPIPEAEKEVAAGTELPPQEKTSEPENPDGEKQKKKKEPKIAKVYTEEDDAFKMAEHIHEKAAAVHGSAYSHIEKRFDIQKWAADINKLLHPHARSNAADIAETDEERLDIVWEVLIWTFENNFWKEQVWTAKSFVEKFFDIRMRMNSKRRTETQSLILAEKQANVRFKSREDEKYEFLRNFNLGGSDKPQDQIGDMFQFPALTGGSDDNE